MVDIVPQGHAVVGIAAGKVGDTHGYGVVWREDIPSSDGGVLKGSAAAVIDDSGKLMIGPHPVGPPLEYVRTPAVAWTGSTYLIAAGEPVTLATGILHTTRVRMAATDLGLIVTWTEEGDETLPSEAPGRSRLRVLVLDDDGDAPAPATSIDTTKASANGYTDAVALAWPRSVIVSWPGASPNASGHTVVWGARLDCAP